MPLEVPLIAMLWNDEFNVIIRSCPAYIDLIVGNLHRLWDISYWSLWQQVKPIVYFYASHIYVAYLLPLNVLVKCYTLVFTGFLWCNLGTSRSFWSSLTVRMFCCSFLLLWHWWDILVSTMRHGCSCWREEGTWALSSDETESGGKWTTRFTLYMVQTDCVQCLKCSLFCKDSLICSFLFLAVYGHRSLVFCSRSPDKEWYHIKLEQDWMFRSNQWQHCICLMELCIITLIYKVVCYLSNYLPMILKKKGVNASQQYILIPKSHA